MTPLPESVSPHIFAKDCHELVMPVNLFILKKRELRKPAVAFFPSYGYNAERSTTRALHEKVWKGVYIFHGQ